MMHKCLSTVDSPEILIDLKEGYFELSGKSIMKFPRDFYGPILKLFDNFNCKNFTLKIEAEYLNSTSIKYLAKLLSKISKYNKSVEVKWCHEPDDDSIKELGEDFRDEFPNFAWEFIQS